MRRLILALGLLAAAVPGVAPAATDDPFCVHRRTPGPYMTACRFTFQGYDLHIWAEGGPDGGSVVVEAVLDSDPNVVLASCSSDGTYPHPFRRLPQIPKLPLFACQQYAYPNVVWGTVIQCRSRGGVGVYGCSSI